MLKESEESGIEEKGTDIRNERFNRIKTREVITPENYQRTKVLGSPDDGDEKPPSKRNSNSKRKVRRKVEKSREALVPKEEIVIDKELDARRKQDAIEKAFEAEPSQKNTPRNSPPREE